MYERRDRATIISRRSNDVLSFLIVEAAVIISRVLVPFDEIFLLIFFFLCVSTEIVAAVVLIVYESVSYSSSAARLEFQSII